MKEEDTVRTRTKAKIGIAGLGAVALSMSMALPAHADYEPISTDVVGVGGDTPQFDLQTLASGDTSGDLGFNAAGAYNRLVTFNASADGNARNAYTSSVTTGVPSVALNPTDVLRAGSSPVQRVSSSGNAITALLADYSTATPTPPEKINFIFSGSLPSPTQQSQAASQGWGFLHVVQIATDNIVIAGSNTTNAPAGLTIADLVGIYNGTITTWNQIPGNSTGSTATIVPLLPPTSSTVYKTLLADIQLAGGSSTLVGTTVEQNDPTTVASNPNAIVPFSNARFNLYTSGYFRNPATAFPGGSAISAGAKALTGAVTDPPTASVPTPVAYDSQIFHYVIFRQSDASLATPFEPGGSKNWVQTLFSSSTSTPLVDKPNGQALIAASGATPSYSDLGNAHS
jgi:PBP superfamily domain